MKQILNLLLFLLLILCMESGNIKTAAAPVKLNHYDLINQCVTEARNRCIADIQCTKAADCEDCCNTKYNPGQIEQRALEPGEELEILNNIRKNKSCKEECTNNINFIELQFE